jgi:hypothetical protein
MSQEDTILTIPEEIVVQIAEVGVQGPEGPEGPTGPTGPTGPQGPAGAPGSAPQAYTHDQVTPASTWTIVHSLGYHPNVAVVDSAGDGVEGLVTYVDVNTVTVEFNAAFGGKAYLS